MVFGNWFKTAAQKREVSRRNRRAEAASCRSRSYRRRLLGFTEQLEDRRLLAVLTVNSFADNLTAGDGLVTLREAVIAANTDSTTDLGETASGADEIILTAGNYVLSIAGTEEDAAATGDLDITSSITIIGAGADQTTIDGLTLDRVIHVLPGGNTAVISDLKLTGGDAGTGAGGAVFADGDANVSVYRSTITGNAARLGGGIGTGNNSNVLVRDSTLSSNTADFAGGGFFKAESSSAFATITNSTISGNSSGTFGGGIDARRGLVLTNSTITGNTTGSTGGGWYDVTAAGEVVSIDNNIFAGNTPQDISHRGGGVFGTNNIVQDGSDAGTNLTGTINQDPQLGPLQDNGGPTFTHALGAGSPAIDAGDSPAATDAASNPLVTDQRGFGPRNVGGTVDIGAFEFGATLPSAPEISTVVQLSTDGTIFSDDLQIDAGDEVWVRIHYDNTGDAAASNAQATLTLPAGVSLVADSTRTVLTPDAGETLGNEAPGQSGAIDETAVWTAGTLTISPQAGLYDQAVDATSGLLEFGKKRFINLHSGHYFNGVSDRFWVSADTDAVGTNVSNSSDGSASVAETFAGFTRAFTGLRHIDLLGNRYLNYHECHYNFFTDHIYADTDGTATRASNTEDAAFNCAGTSGAHILHPDSFVQNFDLSGNRYVNLQQGRYNNGSDTISVNIGPGVSTTSNTPDTSALAPATFAGYTLQDASFLALDTLDASRGSGFVEFKIDTSGASGGDVDLTAVIADLSGSSEFDDQSDSGTLSILSPDSFVVDIATDVVNGDMSPGDVSLREAIIAANANPNRSTITFDPSLDGSPIALTISGSSEDASATGDLDVTSEVIVQGNGVSNTIVDGGGLGALDDRIFDVLSGGSLTLTDANVMGGYLTPGGSLLDVSGAGIRSHGTLMVQRSAITANSAIQGGGIFSDGQLSVSDSTISANAARSVSGGGIWLGSTTASIRNSTIDGNVAGDQGGGVHLDSGSLLIENSTFSNNEGPNSSAVRAQSGTTLDVINSTFSGNRNGVGTLSIRGVATVTNSTIANNPGRVGGGIFQSGAGPVTVNNTIISGNTAQVSGPTQAYGTFSGSNNIIEDGSGTGLTGTITDDPLLGPLQDNGGPTLTHAIDFSSPAINAGDNYLALDSDNNMLTTDQRGAGFDRIVLGTVDIGAFEAQIPTTIVVTTESDENDGTIDPNQGDGTSLREAIIAANSNPDATTIMFDASMGVVRAQSSVLGTGEDAALDGDFDITSEIILVGNGTRQTIIENFVSVGPERLFHVLGGGSLSVQDVKIRGGRAHGDVPNSYGGGIYVEDGGSATILNTEIEDGSAGFGGAVFSSGDLSVTNSSFSFNSADEGGGIYLLGGTATVINSTVSSNWGNVAVGGILNNGATLTISHSTIVNSFTGEGISTGAGSSTALNNSIVAGNAGGDLTTAGTLTGTHNLIEDGSGPTLQDTIVAAPMLSELWDFTGPTKTHYLLPGSPAIDAGSNANATADGSVTGTPLVADQRGHARVQFGTVDIGAVEIQPVDSLVVDTASDVIDANDGVTSLREAIIEANRVYSETTITFDASLDTTPLILSPPDSKGPSRDDMALEGDLDIRTIVVLQGNGPDNTLIYGGDQADLSGSFDRVVDSHYMANLDLSGVTISRGWTDGSGGGIQSDGVLSIDNSVIDNNYAGSVGGGIELGNPRGMPIQVTITGSTISNNQAENAPGGGIMNDGTTLILEDSTVTGNSANRRDGGGIATFGGGGLATLLMRRSTVSDNTASGRGGGIFSGDDHVEIDDSTISGNTADGGGGIFVTGYVNRDTLIVRNSTVSGNVSTGDGGGIAIDSDNAFIYNSTISGNSASGNGGGVFASDDENRGVSLTIGSSTIAMNSTSGGVGGGIHNSLDAVTLHNTILAGNTSEGVANDFWGAPVLEARHTLIGDAASAGGITDGANGNLVGVGGVGLRPTSEIIDTTLADNGGPTSTHALAGGSVAINSGDASLLPADAGDQDGDSDIAEPMPFDQRGTGFGRVRGGSLDIGAVEAPGAPSLDINTGLSLAATAMRTITDSELSASSDGGGSAVDLVYTITSGPSNAMVALASDPGTAVSSFTQQDVLDGNVLIVQDGRLGSDSFEFSLSDPNGNSGPFTFALTVTQAQVEFAELSSVQMENEASSGPQLAVLGDLRGTSDLARTVVFTAPSGTATNGVDYTLSNIYVIPEGNYETATNFDLAALPDGTPTLQVIDDDIVEPNETVTFSFLAFGQATVLGNANGGFLVVSAAHTIDSEDIANLSITSGASAVAEGNVSPDDDSSITYTVSIDKQVQSGFTVALDTLLGTDAEAEDFTLSTGSISFGAFDTADKTFTLTTHGDLIVEDNETIQVNLGDVTPGFDGDIVSGAFATTMINNDDTATLTISAPAGQIIESDSDQEVEFTITIDAAVEGGFDISGTITGGDTEAGDLSLASPVTFNGEAGESQPLLVTIVGDQIVEGNESFTITLGTVVSQSAEQDASMTSGASADATIHNDDTATLSISIPEISEGDEDETVDATVSLDAEVEGGLSVEYALLLGSAEATDVNVGSDPLVFVGESGETQFVRITIVGDDIVEDNETFTITLGTATGSTAEQTAAVTSGASAPGTINNDDLAALSISIPEITESDEDQTVNATVTLDSEVEGGLSVAYELTLDSAEATDVSVGSLPLKFDGVVGEARSIEITIVGDDIVEDNETFLLTFGDVTETSVVQASSINTRASAEGTIDNDDTATLSISIPEITEGDEDQTVNATVALDAEVEGGLAVGYSLTLGSAEATDVALAGEPTLMFVGNAGETQSLAISITGDDIVEDAETFTVTLGMVDYTSEEQIDSVTSGASDEGTILNDDSASLSISIPEITEDDEGQVVSATVTLDAEVEGGLNVAYALSLGTAEATDVSVGSAPLTFAGNSGETQPLEITIAGDDIVEDNETFTVTLGAVDNTSTEQAANVTTGASAEGTIVNDDSATLTITIPEITESDEDQTVNATVTIDAEVEGGFSVEYALQLGDAEATDVSVGPGPLSFTGTSGESLSLPITIVGDNIVEANESFSLSLGEVTGTSSEQITSIGSGTSAEAVIDNDDTATLSISIPEITETDEDQTVNATVTLDAAVEGGLSVDYALELGDAEASDVSVNSSSLSFAGASGETQSLEVTIAGDDIVEDNESFSLTLGAVGNADEEQIDSVTSGASADGTINNDDSATLSISMPEITEGDEDQTLFATVTLDAEVEGGFQIAGEVTLGTASASDVLVSDRPMSFVGTPGESRDISIIVVGDELLEATETFTVGLGAISETSAEQSSSIDATSTGAGEIVDDETANATLSVQTHGDEENATAIVYRVELDQPNAGPGDLTFDLAFTGGTAFGSDGGTVLSGQDYDGSVAGSGVLVVPAGSHVGTLTVPVVDDNLVEASLISPQETVEATVSDPSYPLVSVATATATANIDDNDVANVSACVASMSGSSDCNPADPDHAAEAGLDQGNFVVRLDKPSAEPTLVSYQVGSQATNEATPGIDYSALSQLVVIPAGETEAVITVLVIDDSVIEPTETVTLKLGGVLFGLPGVAVGGDTQAVINIFDDDTPVDSVAPEVNDIVVGEFGDSRSRVTSLTVEFNEAVNILDDSAFDVRLRDGASVEIEAVDVAPDGLSAVISFAASDVLVDATGSLNDGNYELQIDPTKILDLAGNALGGGDQGVFAGGDGGDFVFGDKEADNFYRLYGDSAGLNRSVDLADLIIFRSAFGKSSSDPEYEAALDANFNGLIDLSELVEFRNKFGKSIGF